MANEARVTAGLQILKRRSTDNRPLIQYNGQPSTFLVDVDGTKGPVPGSISVALAGTDVDLSELTQPGLCKMTNQDDENYVEYGIREPSTTTFYPLGEIGPGESYVIKLSRNLQEEYQGVGTATSAATNFLHFKANTAPVNVLIEAFES